MVELEVEALGSRSLENSRCHTKGGLKLKYYVGAQVINGAGRAVTVKKECLDCKNLMGDRALHKYKCFTRNCPAWTEPELRKPKQYIVVYLDDTDGDPQVDHMTGHQIREFVKLFGHQSIAIIKGSLIKGFDSKMDLKRL